MKKELCLKKHFSTMRRTLCRKSWLENILGRGKSLYKISTARRRIQICQLAPGLQTSTLLTLCLLSLPIHNSEKFLNLFKLQCPCLHYRMINIILILLCKLSKTIKHLTGSLAHNSCSVNDHSYHYSSSPLLLEK